LNEYVAECVRIVDQSGLKYQLTPMATIVEGELDDVMEVVKACHRKVREMSHRVVTTVELDDRAGARNAMEEKVRSVERKLARRWLVLAGHTISRQPSPRLPSAFASW